MSPIQYLNKGGAFSTHLALGSFGIGTLLMLTYKMLPEFEMMLIIGLYYVLIALAVNAVVFLYLLYCFAAYAPHREYFAIKMLIMLANIPIVIFYLYVLFSAVN